MRNINDISDKSLLRQYKTNGDQKHLAMLFGRYKEMIFGVCLKYFKDEEKAKDGCMEIYEKCIDKAMAHKVENIKAWLYVMTKNHCLEKLRKLKTHMLDEKELINMYSEQNLHLDNIEDELMYNKLESCIEKLNKEQQQCIRSFYFEKMTYKLIAKIQGISWNQVRSFIQNARRKLKKCLEQN